MEKTEQINLLKLRNCHAELVSTSKNRLKTRFRNKFGMTKTMVLCVLRNFSNLLLLYI